MAYKINSRYGHSYLGNANPQGDREAHSISNEKPQCQIDTIIKNDHAVGFVPDTLQQAHLDGYDNCSWCIGGSKR